MIPQPDPSSARSAPHAARGACSRASAVAAGLFALLAALLVTAPAQAIPAFARKYGTSCQTCHTVYPKLSPFGEAFRRNGYRFPGVDSDVVKQEVVPLGQDAYKKTFPASVWPGTLPTSIPIAFGFNGQAVFHPDTKSTAAQADNNAAFTMHDLIAEGHLWAGGSFDDTTTFFGEVTVSGGGASLEHAVVIFSDLFFGKHLLNLRVGRTTATLSSFGIHSTYVADVPIPPLSVTALYGATTDSWNVADSYNGLELNGVVAGRLDYSFGVNAGANLDVRASQNVYGHVGAKLGGMRLDGEGAGNGSDATRPWAENALTFDGFVYRSVSHFTNAQNAPASDDAVAFGGGLRAQLGSLELDAGGYAERHLHATATDDGVHAFVQYDELSYIVFPWLVPAVRVEYSRLSPFNGPAVDDLRLIPGVVGLVRPNLKLSLVAQIEKASGAPDAGWGPANGQAVPPAVDAKIPVEIEAIKLGLAFAF